MSLTFKIPPRSKLIPVEISFEATYSAITPFIYEFTSSINTNKFLTKVKKQNVYLLERFFFDGNIQKQDYALARGVFSSLRLLLTFKKQSNSPEFQKPWPLGQYKENNAHIICLNSDQNDDLQATIKGQLIQPPSLIPVPTIVLTWSANLYEIRDSTWIGKYLGPLSNKTGQSLID